MISYANVAGWVLSALATSTKIDAEIRSAAGKGRIRKRPLGVETVQRHISTIMIGALAVLGHGYAAAHHSFAAEFDAQKPITLKGTVVKWEMINPHGWITIDVAEPGGTTTQWMVETSNPNGLMRLGWTKNSLKPGDQITVDAYRAKDGSNTANAARITLADGSKVFAGSAGTPADAPSDGK